jgi:hypothetical protein
MRKKQNKSPAHDNGRASRAAGASSRPSSRRRPQRPVDFYAVVKVRKLSALPAAVRDREGIVTGRAQTAAGRWNYSVWIRGLNKSYYLPHSALMPTGVILKRDELYGGQSIRVRVDRNGVGTEVLPEGTVVGAEEA